MTQGWKLIVEWKDGSKTWIPLKDIKDSNPVDVAEFDKAKGIDDEVKFAWWVPHKLKKQDVIVYSIKLRVRKKV